MIPFPYQAAGAGMIHQSVAPPASGWNAAVAALPSLWGWWKLDDTAGAGVSALDASGNGRHGTYTAAGTQTTGLFAGSAGAQATLGGRITVPAYSIPATPQFTLGAFIRTTAGATEQQVIGADGGRFQWRKNTSTGAMEFITIVPSVTTTTAATSIADGNPHLVMLVFDQTLAAGSGRVKLYLDGSLDGSSTTSITLTTGAASSTALGARSNANNNGLWLGAIDDCFIVNSALSSADIAALWATRNT
jgi:hypothetical protein